MMSVWIVLGIIFIHWFADFVLQTDWQAKNKSTNNSALLQHTTIYTIIWIIPAILVLGYTPNFSIFIIITFITHTITDYFTSRLNTKLYKANKIHKFFVSIGFDQFLHYTQLLLTYYYLTK